MTGRPPSPVSDHAVLRYLERVLKVDVDAVRRIIHGETRLALDAGARGCTVNVIAYRIKGGYVTTCFVGAPFDVQNQHRRAAKRILRKAKEPPILVEE